MVLQHRAALTTTRTLEVRIMATQEVTTSTAPAIDTRGHVEHLRAIARMMLRAVEVRHEYQGVLNIGIEHLQVSATLLKELWDEIQEAKDMASGSWSQDLLNEVASKGMRWYQARAMIELIESDAWQAMEKGDDISESWLAVALSDMEHGLRRLCALLDAIIESLPAPCCTAAATLKAA